MNAAAQAPSWPEALLVCSSYSIPRPSERPVDMRPYRDCVTATRDRFAGALNPHFEKFARELDRAYALQQEVDWTPALGVAYDRAMQAIFRLFWQNPEGIPESTPRPDILSWITPEERSAIEMRFPETARVLGIMRARSARELNLDPRLERLRAALSGLRTTPSKTAPPQAVDCRRWIHFGAKVDYLTREHQDISELMRNTQRGADQEMKKLMNRYWVHLGEAEAELSSSRAILSDSAVACSTVH